MSVAMVLFAICTITSGCYDRQLSDEELEPLFTEAVVRGTHETDHYNFERQFKSDGTFTQEGGDYSGSWEIKWNELCIVWNPPHHKAHRRFCRRVMTDDAGKFWKEFDKGNGDTLIVVRYSSIRDNAGNDRLPTPSASERRSRWMGTWRGVLVYIFGGLFGFVMLRKFLRGKSEPFSLRNRIKRKVKGVQIGGIKHSYSELQRYSDEKLVSLLGECIEGRHDFEFQWVTRVLFRRAPDSQETVNLFWGRVKLFGDMQAEQAVTDALFYLAFPQLNIAAANNQPRFTYFLGKAHTAQALLYQTNNLGLFEHHKNLAITYLDHARALGKPPPPELAPRSSPYREDPYQAAIEPDYATLAFLPYESIFYANYTPPVVATRSSSSSYSGGG